MEPTSTIMLTTGITKIAAVLFVFSTKSPSPRDASSQRAHQFKRKKISSARVPMDARVINVARQLNVLAFLSCQGITINC